MPTRVVIESRLAEIARHAETMAPLIVQKTGLEVEGGAKERIVANGSVDTGNMLNSVAWMPMDDLSGEVVVGAEYGIFVEAGSTHGPRTIEASSGVHTTRAYTIPAKPFLAPAAEDARPGFEAAVSHLFD